MRYRAVLFDLFDTLAHFEGEKLPSFEWDGRLIRSTLGGIRAVFERLLPGADYRLFARLLAEAGREIGEARRRDCREVPARERFRRALVGLGAPEPSRRAAVAEELSLAHMRVLAAAAEVPPAHRDLLVRLRDRYPLGLVSNFDHGPTARCVLTRGGIEACFDAVAISDETGWRKPHPAAFAAALAPLGVDPREALFVGDSPVEDIGGAKRASLWAAWVRRPGASYPPGVPQADFVLAGVTEVVDLL